MRTNVVVVSLPEWLRAVLSLLFGVEDYPQLREVLRKERETAELEGERAGKTLVQSGLARMEVERKERILSQERRAFEDERAKFSAEIQQLRAEAKTLREIASKREAPALAAIAWHEIERRVLIDLPPRLMDRLEEALTSVSRGQELRVTVVPLMDPAVLDARTWVRERGYDRRYGPQDLDAKFTGSSEHTIAWAKQEKLEDNFEFGRATARTTGTDPKMLRERIEFLLLRPVYGLGFVLPHSPEQPPQWFLPHTALKLRVIVEQSLAPEVRWIELPVAVTPPTPE